MRRWLLSLFLVLSFVSFSYSQSEVSVSNGEVLSFQGERDLPIFQEENIEQIQSGTGSTFGLLIELFFLLIFLSVLLYGFILFIKKIGKSKVSSNFSSDFSSFRILGEQVLSDGKFIKIIEIYSQVVVVGETSQSINFLYEIKDADIKNRVLLDYSKFQSNKKESKKSSFFSQLQEKIKINTNNTRDSNSSLTGDSDNEGSQSMEHFKESKERLKNL